MADVSELLKPIEDFQFVIYADIDRPEDHGHLHFRPLSRPNFLSDLSDCNGVIANAGFETVSEALQLGKKVLVKPLWGQLEQLSNAEALAILKLGTVMPQLNRHTVETWLRRTPSAPVNYPDVAQMLVEWIEAKQWDRTADLVDAAWANVILPE